MEEIIYYGADSAQAGSIKEIKILPDKQKDTTVVSKEKILDIKLKAIADKLGVDLEAVVEAATNG